MKCIYCGQELPNNATKCTKCKAAVKPIVIKKKKENKYGT